MKYALKYALAWLCIAVVFSTVARAQEPAARWSKETADAWYADQPWLVGCNYIPRTAINQLEMWQGDTFDLATIDQELTWAQHTGFNTLRVFLHDKAYEADPAGFRQDQYHFRLGHPRGIADAQDLVPRHLPGGWHAVRPERSGFDPEVDRQRELRLQGPQGSRV